MTDDLEDKVGIRYFDEPFDTSITISCHRETHRLDRMLKIFHKALEFATEDNLDIRLREGLVKLHDHKGQLTVTWRHPNFYDYLHGYVRQAWEEFGETEIRHEDKEGEDLPRPLRRVYSEGPEASSGFQKFADLLPGVLERTQEAMKNNKDAQ